jgi:hydroxyacid-oxoacid transhydrogenase
VVTDAGVAGTIWPQRVAEAMSAYGVQAQVYDRVHAERIDVSGQETVDTARESGPWGAFIVVGGGSSIDTAKAHQPADDEPRRADGLHQPAGRQGRAPTEPLRPLVAVPTTTGTGSESTTHLRADVLALKVKTGISHARLRPSLAVVDPRLARAQPPLVTAASGLDILCHALQS